MAKIGKHWRDYPKRFQRVFQHFARVSAPDTVLRVDYDSRSRTIGDRMWFERFKLAFQANGNDNNEDVKELLGVAGLPDEHIGMDYAELSAIYSRLLDVECRANDLSKATPYLEFFYGEFDSTCKFVVVK